MASRRREVDAVARDERVDDVEVALAPAVELDHPAVVDDERRFRVVGRVEGDQAERRVLDGEAVEVDALRVHEPVAADARRSCLPLEDGQRAAAQATSCAAVPPLTPTPPTTRPSHHSGRPPPKQT